ncbi:type IV secretion protein DotIE [Citrobacter freundii]|uniref:type IV secretion protein DotIE n=1 Tax=Citrobacter freundii TaxID=546 RepID=UPI0019089C34|nr:type IV secretion protein DotIE [Citrobacter freundii]MBJ8931598.1 type IV secretion protein DotIE [Citrobacter freundii]
MPDLISVMINVGQIAPIFIMVLQGLSILAGTYLVASSLIDFYLTTNDNSSKMFSSNSKVSVGGASVKLIVGGFLVGLGTLQVVGIFSRSLTGDYVNSRMMSYSTSGTSIAEQAQLAVLALLSIMQAVGMSAIYRGFWALVERHNGNQQGNSYARIAGWFIGGLLAWNFKWTSDVVNNQLGFNIISILTPF